MPADDGRPEKIAATVTEVSERINLLIRDEIALARAEVTLKAKSLGRGVAWFAIAAILGLFGVIFLPMTIAWLLDALLLTGAGDYWVGFAIVTAAFLIGAAAFAALGINKMRVGSPTPNMAIEEARKIRETMTSRPQ